MAKKTVSILVERYLRIEEGPSESTQKADYEAELRELIRQRDGEEKIKELFPSHIQSHVLSRKKTTLKKACLKIRKSSGRGKFWNKDLYNNRVIFNPYTAAD